MQNQQGYQQNRPTGPRQAPANGPDRKIPPRAPNSNGPRKAPPNRGGNGSNGRRRPPSKTGSGNGARVASALLRVIITVIGCVFLAIFVLRSASDLFGLNQIDKPYNVTIPDNYKIKDLSKLLKDNGIIDQKLTFQLYSNLKYKGQPIVKGDYVLNSDMSYDQIMDKLTAGNVTRKTVKITFVEGVTLDDVAQTLQDENVCNATEFLEYLQTADLSDYDFYKSLPKDELLYLRTEGYIFPDTYEFYEKDEVNQVANKFLMNFDNHMTPEILDRMKEMDMNLHEMVTLASIIQKEAGKPEEMRRVSSVFHNRLKNGEFQQLQSDVTIFYVEKHIKGKNRPYTVMETQNLYDAYNTYKRKDLPVGPVCNPGEEAIMAALYPAQTDDYYFVTDIHEHFYYAPNLDKHIANIALAEQADESGEGKIGGGVMTPRNSEDAKR